jgi:hypothetical protein
LLLGLLTRLAVINLQLKGVHGARQLFPCRSPDLQVAVARKRHD